MPRVKLQSGKTTVLKDLQAKSQKMQQDLVKMQKEAAVLKKLLAGVKDDSQLANLKLQNQLQKTSQAFTTMSNMMKTNHDTVNSTIRNIR